MRLVCRTDWVVTALEDAEFQAEPAQRDAFENGSTEGLTSAAGGGWGAFRSPFAS